MSRTVASEALEAAEQLLRTSRRVTSRVLDRVQLRLHAWKTSLTPEASEWDAKLQYSIEHHSQPRGDTTRDNLQRRLEKEQNEL